MRLTLQCDTCNSTFYSEPGRFEPDELCGLALSDDGPVCPGSLRDITPLSLREQARLARIQEQSRQLSLEECVYWLVMADELAPISLESIARRDLSMLLAVARRRLDAAKTQRRLLKKTVDSSLIEDRLFLFRRLVTAVWLLRQAAKRIREEQRIREQKP